MAIRHKISLLFWLAVAGGSSVVIVALALYLYLNPMLPSVDVLKEAKLETPLRIYSQNGELIGEFGEKFRTPVSLEQVPQSFVDAILSAEDDRFLEHSGVDIAGLARAASELLNSGQIRTGGSTITMQVARNFFLSREQTFLRKFNEILLALKIERLLSKEEILELYFNKIYLGKRAYGVGAAAAVYYGKSIDELSIAQLAMIAGLPKAPSAFNPINNPQRAVIRRNWILGRMLKLNHIDELTYQAAIVEPVTAAYHGPKLSYDAKYPAEMARLEAIDRYGLAAYSDGYSIYTTIDIEAQKAAQKAIVSGIDSYNQRHGYRGSEKSLLSIPANQWQKTLEKTPTVNGIEPAAIVAILTEEEWQLSQAESEPDEENILANDNAEFTTAPLTNDVEADTEIEEEQEQPLRLIIVALAKNGDTITIPWQPSKALRKFVTENRTSAIDDIRDILKEGDVIRVKHSSTQDPTYTLTELPSVSAALVSLNADTGDILAIVGGYDFSASSFNRATQAKRQPGSNFKPFVYAAALDRGFTAAKVINDAPIVFQDDQLESEWRPENSSGKFYGPTRLRKALYLSRNLVSIRVLREVGIEKTIDYLEAFPFLQNRLPNDLSLSLGSAALTPLEVATMYTAIANGGYVTNPHIVNKIVNQQGEVVFERKAHPCIKCRSGQDLVNETTSPIIEDELNEAESLDSILAESTSEEKEIAPDFDPRIMYVVDSMLKDVIQRGTGTRAKSLKRGDIAGKTGTTNGPVDAWFSGYTEDIVTTTWLGFDDNRFLGRREFGGSAALPIWIDYMKEVLPNYSETERKMPSGMKSVLIDNNTGEATTRENSNAVFEVFRSEFAPSIQQNESSNDEQIETDVFEEIF